MKRYINLDNCFSAADTVRLQQLVTEHAPDMNVQFTTRPGPESDVDRLFAAWAIGTTHFTGLITAAHLPDLMNKTIGVEVIHQFLFNGIDINFTVNPGDERLEGVVGVNWVEDCMDTWEDHLCGDHVNYVYLVLLPMLIGRNPSAEVLMAFIDGHIKLAFLTSDYQQQIFSDWEGFVSLELTSNYRDMFAVPVTIGTASYPVVG
jgi:hypothetical protein